MARIDPSKLNLEEKVVQINRVAKVVQGGRRFSFSAVVVVGDGNGNVGAGIGKAGEVPEAIRKGVEDAKKHLIKVPLVGSTIPHEVHRHFGASDVMLKPASAGTGVIAGGSVRSVVEAAAVEHRAPLGAEVVGRVDVGPRVVAHERHEPARESRVEVVSHQASGVLSRASMVARPSAAFHRVR